jgi:hypothetical protein
MTGSKPGADGTGEVVIREKTMEQEEYDVIGENKISSL